MHRIQLAPISSTRWSDTQTARNGWFTCHTMFHVLMVRYVKVLYCFPYLSLTTLASKQRQDILQRNGGPLR